MQRLKRAPRLPPTAELDITSFMNLMIVLVPVLLMSMVFANITVLKINLPGLAKASSLPESEQQQPLEVVLRQRYLDVNFPAGTRLQRLPVLDTGEFDLAELTTLLQAVKTQLAEQGIDKDDVRLLAEDGVSYQTLVSVMDAVRSYPTVVVTSVVEAELFPNIALGDAPLVNDATAGATE